MLTTLNHLIFQIIISQLYSLLKVLEGSPIGLKLNIHLNNFFLDCFKYHIELWSTFLGMLENSWHRLCLIKYFKIFFRSNRTDCSSGVPCHWRFWLPGIHIPNRIACRSDINSWPACSLFLRLHQSVREIFANKRFEILLFPSSFVD